ncbi:MAG: hypothetical protein Kow0065_17380 [Methylomicrobium sp.]
MWLSVFSVNAQAFHQDIDVKGVGSQLQTGFCSATESGCDIVGVAQLGLPEGTLPRDYRNDQDIYVTQFFRYPGSTATDSPGFQAHPGDLTEGELVRYQAVGVLSYWDPVTERWHSPPADVRIRLAGGFDLQSDQSCGLVICPPKTVSGFTLYTSGGLAGNASLLVGEARRDGSFHSHLDWFLESSSGTQGGPAGAYLVEMKVFSEQRSEPSKPFFILFNHDLTDAQFQTAVSMRVLPHLEGRIDALYDWAENHFPELFPHTGHSQYLFGYYARCYDNSVCIGTQHGKVWATGGPFGTGIVEVGSVEYFLNEAGL